MTEEVLNGETCPVEEQPEQVEESAEEVEESTEE